MYTYHQTMGQSCQENWLKRVQVRKIEISNNVKEIFGNEGAVSLVPYSGRVQKSFPFPNMIVHFRL